MAIDTVRKNFKLKSDLESRLVKYCEKTGLTQAQALNLAVRSFLDMESFKSWIVNNEVKTLDNVSGE